MKRSYFIVSIIVAALLMVACAGSETGSNEASSTTAFPSSLAVASPVDYTQSVAANVSASIKAASGGYVPRYTVATLAIDAILNGTTSGACIFDARLFLTQSEDAECYGPTVDYDDHPDWVAGPNQDGELPVGDLGMWAESDDATGHACAAAEFNARMSGIRDKSMASLSGLASLICTVNVNSLTLPTNSTLTVTTEMNALGITDVNFTTASISHSNSSGSDRWSYALEFNYSPGSNSYDVVVEMAHIPGTSAANYQGRLSYLVNNTMVGGNCPGGNVTQNGSMLYERTGTDVMSVEVRDATFCGSNADGRVDGIVDPAQTYNAATNPDGWTDDFNIMTANYDPTTLEGNYAYSWQAGFGDDNSRVFNMVVPAADEATAFYGYGEDVDSVSFDGSIDGFICNWAGPQANHTLQTFAQYQTLNFNATTGKVEAGTSNISYAPTNSCDYDGSGTFTYDSDFDGAEDTNPAIAINNDLLNVTDADADGAFDEIESSGFSLPATPPNL